MVKKINSFALLFLLASLAIQARVINFTLPEEANKNFIFYIPNGLKQDTLAQGSTNFMGYGTIKIPDRYKSIPAMGTLKIEQGRTIDIILENTDLTITQSSDQKTLFSPLGENNLLHYNQEELMQKNNATTYAQFYAKTYNIIARAAKLFSQSSNPSLYERTNINLALRNDIDFDKLYYSKFWFYAIDALMKLSSGQKSFADDMIKILDKTKTPLVYTALVKDLITITNQFGMDDAFDLILSHVKDSGRIEYPTGEIFDAFKMLTVRKGSIAPAIEGLKPENNDIKYDYRLVIFHQPGCDHCHAQLQQINNNIDFFKNNKVRIISISGDTDRDSFEKEKKNLLWPDKLCDYKSFGGANFQNYGIVATPIIFLLKDNNLVIGRFSSVEDIKKHLSTR